MPKQRTCSPETKFLLCASRTALDAATLTQLATVIQQNLDWEKVFELSCLHRIAALVYHTLSRTECALPIIPQNTIEKLRNYYYRNLSRTLKLWRTFCGVYDRFIQHRIECIPLKGIIVGNLLYHNPALRTIMADIDILIKKSDVSGATAQLKEMGWAVMHTAPHETLFEREGVRIDLHTHLLPPWVHGIDIERLWRRTREEPIERWNIKVLSFEDMLLSASLQIRHDWPYFYLFRLCDIHEILVQKCDALDWGYLGQGSKEFGIGGTLYFALYVCQQLLSSPLPKDFKKIVVPQGLRRRILDAAFEKEVAGLFRSDLQHVHRNSKNRSLKFLMNDRFIDSLRIGIHT